MAVSYKNTDYRMKLADVHGYYHRYITFENRNSPKFGNLQDFIGVHGMLEVMRRLMIEYNKNENVSNFIDYNLTSKRRDIHVNAMTRESINKDKYEDAIKGLNAYHSTYHMLNAKYNQGDAKKVYDKFYRVLRLIRRSTFKYREIENNVIEWAYDAAYAGRRKSILPRHRTSPVIGLAQAIYDGEAFDRMPVLADALEESGLDDPQILGHLRSFHNCTRANWVLVRVLRKERY